MSAGIRAGGSNDGYFVVNGTDRISIDSTGKVTIPATVASTSSTTGSLVVAGGVGVGGSIFAGGTINSSVPLFFTGKTLSSTLTITATQNVMSPGPISIADGVIITIADGGEWSIV